MKALARGIEVDGHGRSAERGRFAVARQQAKAVWCTTLWPAWPGELPLPWGGFIGVAVRLS
jgi:hypothetical protein